MANLARAVKSAGHECEVITMPFRFSPPDQVLRSMDVWETEDLNSLNGYGIDRLICMRFPTWYAKHDNKVCWILHQHRAVYDLWDTPFSGGLESTKEGIALRDAITQRDTASLRDCRKIFTNSKLVSDRLARYNQLASKPLYHPPPIADKLYTDEPESYILATGRLESLKRVDLLIDAMQHVHQPVVALITGEGGQKQVLQRRIEEQGLGHKVRLLGKVSLEELLRLYAKCLGVFFGPYEEDMGYITLEAMLAAKPVITCTDSGGPLEFVVHRETGVVVTPDAYEVAAAIDDLCSNRRRAAAWGNAGLHRYQELGISWDHVLESLLHE